MYNTRKYKNLLTVNEYINKIFLKYKKKIEITVKLKAFDVVYIINNL